VRDTLGHRRIRLLDGPGDQLVPLPGLDAPAAYDDWDPSPDRTGAFIAFVSNRNGNPDVFVYDAGGDSVLALPTLASAAIELDPSLTPDGRYLAFASDRGTGQGGLDLFVYDLTLRTYLILTGLNGPGNEQKPSLSPDGGILAFQSDRAGGLGQSDIWIYSRAAATVTQAGGLGSADDDVEPSLKWP